MLPLREFQFEELCAEYREPLRSYLLYLLRCRGLIQTELHKGLGRRPKFPKHPKKLAVLLDEWFDLDSFPISFLYLKRDDCLAARLHGVVDYEFGSC